MGKKSLISGIKEQAHHILRQVILPHPPHTHLVSKNISTSESSGGNTIKEQNTLTAANETESLELPAMLSVASTSSQY